MLTGFSTRESTRTGKKGAGKMHACIVEMRYNTMSILKVRSSFINCNLVLVFDIF